MATTRKEDAPASHSAMLQGKMSEPLVPTEPKEPPVAPMGDPNKRDRVPLGLSTRTLCPPAEFEMKPAVAPPSTIYTDPVEGLWMSAVGEYTMREYKGFNIDMVLAPTLFPPDVPAAVLTLKLGSYPVVVAFVGVRSRTTLYLKSPRRMEPEGKGKMAAPMLRMSLASCEVKGAVQPTLQPELACPEPSRLPGSPQPATVTVRPDDCMRRRRVPSPNRIPPVPSAANPLILFPSVAGLDAAVYPSPVAVLNPRMRTLTWSPKITCFSWKS